MKKIIIRIRKAIRRIRYRRLYYRLVWHFLAKGFYGEPTCQQANEVFSYLTGEDWPEWFVNNYPRI